MELYLIWLILGLVLIGLEIIIPGFVVIFFGLAAVAVGALCWAFPSIDLAYQIGLFAVLSLVMVWLLRKLFKNALSGKSDSEPGVDDAFTGQYAEVVRAIAPGNPGKVTFNGTDWQAESDRELTAGTRVRIVRRDNITLIVE